MGKNGVILDVNQNCKVFGYKGNSTFPRKFIKELNNFYFILFVKNKSLII